MNTHHAYCVPQNGTAPSRPNHSYQQRTGNVPLVVHHNPYARIPSGQIMMMAPSGTVAAVNTNFVMGMGMGMTNSTVGSPPPLTSFARHLTPEYLVATASMRPSPLVGYQSQQSENMSNFGGNINRVSSSGSSNGNGCSSAT